MDWSCGDDLNIRRELKRLSNNIDRMRRLKRGGVSSYTGELGDEMRKVLGQLQKHGLFLVPVGELEEWLAGRDVGVSKSDKRQWSNAAAQLIQKLGPQDDDVWAFVSSVARFLSTGNLVLPSEPPVAVDSETPAA